MMKKVCTLCKKEQPETEFYLRRKNMPELGRQSRCRTCVKDQSKNYARKARGLPYKIVSRNKVELKDFTDVSDTPMDPLVEKGVSREEFIDGLLEAYDKEKENLPQPVSRPIEEDLSWLVD